MKEPKEILFAYSENIENGFLPTSRNHTFLAAITISEVFGDSGGSTPRLLSKRPWVRSLSPDTNKNFSQYAFTKNLVVRISPQTISPVKRESSDLPRGKRQSFTKIEERPRHLLHRHWHYVIQIKIQLVSVLIRTIHPATWWKQEGFKNWLTVAALPRRSDGTIASSGQPSDIPSLAGKDQELCRVHFSLHPPVFMQAWIFKIIFCKLK